MIALWSWALYYLRSLSTTFFWGGGGGGGGGSNMPNRKITNSFQKQPPIFCKLGNVTTPGMQSHHRVGQDTHCKSTQGHVDDSGSNRSDGIGYREVVTKISTHQKRDPVCYAI
jgi:hypothetical protein